MKSINSKIMGVLATVLFASCFTSCSNEPEYTAADPAGNGLGVRFAESSVSVELDPTDPTTYSVGLVRSNTSGALTVPVTVYDGDKDIFTVTDGVFADGESEASVNLSFPNATVGTEYSVSLAITDPSIVTVYNDSVTCNFSVTRVKWNNVGYYVDDNGNKVEGYANYTEDFLTTFFGVSNVTWPVALQERDDKPGYFRIKNAYHEGYPYNAEGDYDADTDSYIYIDATDPDAVYIPHYCTTGMDWGYGEFRMSSKAGYYLAKGDEETAADYYGTYANGKITFPVEALMVSMASYNGGGFYSANTTGAFKLVIDPSQDLYEASVDNGDFEFSLFNDFDLTSAQLGTNNSVNVYKGTCVTKTDGCDTTYVQTYGTPYYIESPYAEDYNIYFNVTEDGKVLVTSEEAMQPIGIKAMGSDVYAVINASQSKFSESEITLNITFQNLKGDIVYGTTNEVLEHATWTQIATGNFAYSCFLSEYTQEGMKLYQKDQDKSVYKLTPFFYSPEDDLNGVEIKFTMDDKNNIHLASDQPTGYEYSSYGPLYVCEYSDVAGEGDPSYYENGTYNFHIVYYVEAGALGYGWETFTVTSTNSSAKAKVAKKAGKPKMKAAKVNKKFKKKSRFVGKRVDRKQNIKALSTAIAD